MTQRVELAIVMDRLAIDALITEYAVAVDDGDWGAYRMLFAEGGRADLRSAGGTEGDAEEVAHRLAAELTPHPVRQHLLVNRRLRFGRMDGDTSDTAEVQADYLRTLRPSEGTEPRLAEPRHTEPWSSEGSPDDAPGAESGGMESGGRCVFTVVRETEGWRFAQVVVSEKWRRVVRDGG
ncbi:nuclear transport factor 2 family protein [Streptomyces tsukubensis]|uniref:SnoaL-like domain-containing protein n=1 Tax=Streptomyces tsukubensis TaxID=83656 RepID=A0A1V4A7E9_9ACTN|nr:nuclear transport factor 2 family protein [Streptomyces tsukubensis]OON77363.1 hypothetical protein B1H18_19205 [Streptomyces tsukubensis]QFR92445.1 nuclear transport factor 2 family protein [Streptomyces tsukubensis]